MNEGKVDCEINGPIASIFFDRPEYRNAVSYTHLTLPTNREV